MSTKRPAIDLMALTSEQATPMPEAMQRSAPPTAATGATARVPSRAPAPTKVPTANLEPLAFKVSPEFSLRFRQRAVNAKLKLNELLFEAFAAWEEQQDHAARKSQNS